MADVNYTSFIWNVADKLRGAYRRSDYGKVILPFSVLRRLDCALDATKAEVLEKSGANTNEGAARDFVLQKASGYSFYNTSPYDLHKLTGDPANLKQNLLSYVEGFSPNVRDVFERYDFATQVSKLDESDLLLLVMQEFLKLDLHPEVVSNAEMGLIFEDLIGRAMEASNEEAGEYFTPRDVVRLIVNLLFARDDEILSKAGVVRTIYDPTAGTGGMLSVADDYVRHLNHEARLTLFGQEINPESYAIAKTDLIIKGQQAENMILGDTLINDGHFGRTFDYGLANPPFGVEWKKQQDFVTKEHSDQGFAGRFGPGVPRVSDGSLLFLMHLVSKMRPASEGGGRIGIVLNGSPLFTGGAGSGESEIRRYLLEKDLVEAIVALPKDMFYNTGIATYIWLLDNDKPKERKGKVQLIDGSNHFEKLRKSIGSKRNSVSQENIDELVKLYDGFVDAEQSKIFNIEDFGYTTITVERPLRQSWALPPARIEGALDSKLFAKQPLDKTDALKGLLFAEAALDIDSTVDLKAFTHRIKTITDASPIDLTAAQLKSFVASFGERDEDAPILEDSKHNPLPDTNLRDSENVPLSQNIEEYVEREIKPHVADFWVDRSKDKVGYEIPFTRHFYKYVPPRELEEIDADLNKLIAEISTLLREVEQ
ncbi:MAG: SAM-dependent DNA methyltransferase [Actinomycetales bacterium]|nr:SAM-dependent DNA methyltransferase [Actinomycetales bacterium]